MNAARRLIVIIFGLAFIALGVLFMATLVNYTVYPYWTAILDKLFTESKITIAVIAVCLIVVGAFSFYSGVAKKAETKIAKISSAEGAGVNISLEAIDSVVKIAASRVVKMLKVRLYLRAMGFLFHCLFLFPIIQVFRKRPRNCKPMLRPLWR